ncbi:MAG: DUF2752 domain-containing protein [Lysobacteraceae bacterium]
MALNIAADTRSPPRWLLALSVAAVLSVATTLLFVVDPASPDNWLPGCPFHALTGLYCPGCGTTRALHALLHFDWPKALSMNPLAVLAIPLLPLLLLHQLHPRLTFARWTADARAWLVLVLAFAILRNLPWAPFIWLAPG